MVAASGIAGGAVAATAAASTSVGAQEDNESSGNETAGNETGGNETAGNETAGGGGGGTEEVIVGPGGDLVFEPAELTIQPGTTVRWIWESDNHNIAPSSVPEGAEWEGYPEIANTGTEYEHTFEVEGEYPYVCEPHVGSGMEGTIVVTSDAGAGGGGAQAEVDVHDLGVPIQAHYVGVATILAIFVSLVFTFYLLKYGESAHTSSPGRK